MTAAACPYVPQYLHVYVVVMCSVIYGFSKVQSYSSMEDEVHTKETRSPFAAMTLVYMHLAKVASALLGLKN